MGALSQSIRGRDTRRSVRRKEHLFIGVRTTAGAMGPPAFGHNQKREDLLLFLKEPGLHHGGAGQRRGKTRGKAFGYVRQLDLEGQERAGGEVKPPQAALLPEIPASSIPAWPQQAQPHQGRRLAERPVSILPPPPAWAVVLSPALPTSTRQPATGRGLLTRPSIHTPDWLRETQPSTAVCADWKPF